VREGPPMILSSAGDRVTGLAFQHVMDMPGGIKIKPAGQRPFDLQVIDHPPVLRSRHSLSTLKDQSISRRRTSTTAR